MALYEQFARVGKALANPARLELLDLLAQGERSVEDLAETAHMKVSNTSAQLRMLAGAGAGRLPPRRGAARHHRGQRMTREAARSHAAASRSRSGTPA